jgi:uncharacterized membrane protein
MDTGQGQFTSPLRESGYQHPTEQRDFGEDSLDIIRQSFGPALRDNAERVARSLGWLSIGLGLVEIMAPRSLAKFLGTRNHGFLFRLVGLREIASGIGILTQERPADWLWARVAGDIIDLSLLGRAFQSGHAHPVNIAVATAAVAGVTALDARCAQELSNHGTATNDSVVKKSILINRSAEELYQHWRNFQNLPRFMRNLESVKITGDRRYRWTAKGPVGSKITWDAEVIEDRANECIAWRSIGGDIDNFGSVRFESAPGGRGTLVKIEMHYSLPAGSVGRTVARFLGRAPEQQVEEDLRHFKQMIETGEIITTLGQPAGRSSSTSWKYDQTIRRGSTAVY